MNAGQPLPAQGRAGSAPVPAGPALAAHIGSFSFHGDDADALRDVRLDVRPGTLTAVLGGSGSGKTTLGKLLAGWLRAGHSGVLRGSLALGAESLQFNGGSDDPRVNPAAWSARVGYVPQDAAAILSTVRTTVAEELAFGLENRGVPRPDMLRQVAHTARQTGLSELLDRDPARLSGGELRRLALGCAVIAGPEVLVLDEPLASLDAAGAGQFRTLLDGLLEAGTAVILLTQAADALARSAGHWLVLNNGTMTAEGRPADVARGTALRDAAVVVDGIHAPLPPDLGPGTGAPVLELRGISFRYPAGDAPAGHTDAPDLLSGLDLTVRAGEIVAITGPNGTGKSTLLRHINGLLRPQAGDVRVLGQSIAGVPTGRIAASAGLLFQQPRDQLFERTVLREAGFGLRRLVGAAAAAEQAREALATVGLADAAQTHPAELPSSRQRLLALATVLARRPALIALDEPTVGLDRHGLDRLHDAITAAAARGAGVVMVTHDAAYARANSHRVLALDCGRLREA